MTLIYHISVYGYEPQMSFRYKYAPYIIDINMADSTYRYCKIEYSDSALVICKERTHGQISVTDSTLAVLRPDALYPLILLMSMKSKQKEATKVVLEASADLIEGMTLYNCEMSDSIDYMPESADTIGSRAVLYRISNAMIPMKVGYLRIKYRSRQQSPIISLKGLPHNSDEVYRDRAVIHNLAKKDFDCIWVKIRTYPPETRCYIRADEDSLTYKVPVFGSPTATRRVSHHLREHRKVLIYKDSTTLPYKQ